MIFVLSCVGAISLHLCGESAGLILLFLIFSLCLQFSGSHMLFPVCFSSVVAAASDIECLVWCQIFVLMMNLLLWCIHKFFGASAQKISVIPVNFLGGLSKLSWAIAFGLVFPLAPLKLGFLIKRFFVIPCYLLYRCMLAGCFYD